MCLEFEEPNEHMMLRVFILHGSHLEETESFLSPTSPHETTNYFYSDRCSILLVVNRNYLLLLYDRKPSQINTYNIRERYFLSLINLCNNFDSKKKFMEPILASWPNLRGAKNSSAQMVSLLGTGFYHLHLISFTPNSAFPGELGGGSCYLSSLCF